MADYKTIRCVWLLFFLAVDVEAVLARCPVCQELPDQAAAMVSIEDSNGIPISGATLEVRRWTGEWIDTGLHAETSQHGEARLEGISTGSYMTLLVKHPEYATQMKDFTASAGQLMEFDFRMLPAATALLQIVTPDGEPVSGAQISRMEIPNTVTGDKTVLTHDMFPLWATGDFDSDAAGQAYLPPMAEGSRVLVKVVHPDWASRTVEVVLKPDANARVIMSKGSRVVYQLHGKQALLSQLEGKLARVRIFSRAQPGEKSSDTRLIHRYPVTDGKVSFCLHSSAYESTYLQIPGVLATPQIGSTGQNVPFLDFSAGHTTKGFVVRSLNKVRGRVVLNNGDPVPQAVVTLYAENLFFDEATGQMLPLEGLGDALLTRAVTNAQGYFEAEVPKGLVKARIDSGICFSDPEVTQWTVKDQRALPAIVARRMPVLKGVVLDDSQQPAENIVLRVPSDVFGEPAYVLTDADGRFEIPLSGLPVNLVNGEREFDYELVGFDPATDLAGKVRVNLRSESECESVTLILENRDADWVIEQVKLLGDHSNEFQAKLDKHFQKVRDAFPAGVAGKSVPDISTGTWFNTDARSLAEFRGKFVLLDFWFIGCGPCERDMPTVRMAHQLYEKLGFSVVSIHIAGPSPQQVKAFADAREMSYPLVVDNANEDILNEFRKLGVTGFPAYLLIDPEGRIVSNDALGDSPPLRLFKLEALDRALQIHTSK